VLLLPHGREAPVAVVAVTEALLVRVAMLAFNALAPRLRALLDLHVKPHTDTRDP
jgi:hypothetical protein